MNIPKRFSKTNMQRTRKMAIIALAIVGAAILGSVEAGFAAETTSVSTNRVSKDVIRKLCEEKGGTFYDFKGGEYGCTFPSGIQVTCPKSGVGCEWFLLPVKEVSVTVPKAKDATDQAVSPSPTVASPTAALASINLLIDGVEKWTPVKRKVTKGRTK